MNTQNILSIYQLIEKPDLDKHEDVQWWMLRAEEDLFCALFLVRHARGYLPLNNICYLLHQSLEKWLKIYLAMNGSEFEFTHDLGYLLNVATRLDLSFHTIYCMLAPHGEVILDKRASSRNMRYGAGNGLDEALDTLIRANFHTRRKVKRFLKVEVL